MERPDQPRANVLVIMVDQMKATASHLYGNAQSPTPHLARLARRGVLYERAYTPHPLCVPARIAMWSARYSHRTGCRTNETKMPEDLWHAFRHWRAAGFTTAMLGKDHCFKDGPERAMFDVWCEISHWGLPARDATVGMEWVRPEAAIEAAHATRRNMPHASGPLPHAVTGYPLEDYSTGLVGEQAIRFLEAHRGKPFAAWVSFPDPHPPFEAPDAYVRHYPASTIALPPSPDREFEGAPERNRVLAEILRWTPDETELLRSAVAVYYAMIRFVDDQIGRILDALDRLGLAEHTIVAFVADHGDFGGEHRMMSKGGVFYDCLTRIPMVLCGPGVRKPGTRVASPVSLIDLVPTILALQGYAVPNDIDGRALPGATSTAARDIVFSEYGCGGPRYRLAAHATRAHRHGEAALLDTLLEREYEGTRAMVTDGTWKFVHDPAGDDDEMYDLATDPWELHNLARSAQHTVRADALRALIVTWRAPQ